MRKVFTENFIRKQHFLKGHSPSFQLLNGFKCVIRKAKTVFLWKHGK
jgi:hypothetical protein